MGYFVRRCFIACTVVVLASCSTPQESAEKPPQKVTSRAKPVRGAKLVLRVGTYVFDPADGLPGLPADLGAVAGDNHFIVQLFEPPSRELRARAQKLGLRLDEYIPEHGYLETLDAKALEAVRALREVRAIVAYAAAFKVSPHIGTRKFRTPERIAKAGVWLNVMLHRGANAASVAEQARAAGATEIEVKDKRGAGAAPLIRVVVASAAEVPKLARLSGVKAIEEVAEQNEDNGTTAGTIQSGVPGTTPLWAQGLHGEGQIVSVNDSDAVDLNHCMFQDPAIATASPPHRKMVERRSTTNSTHATFVAGIVAGDDFNNLGTGGNRGNAWAARIVSTNRSADDALTMLNLNRDSGAKIHTNSWHDDTGNPSVYNQTASDVDTFMWNNEDHIVLGSMGNVGEEQGAPGTAKSAIGVQASSRDPNEGNFGDGNLGPTADGRRKPDVTAPGCTITSAQVSTPCTITTGEIIYATPVAQQPQCATSWATPAAAGAVTLLRQYYTEGFYPSGTREPSNAFTPSGALLKATVLNATVDMAGTAGYPTTTEGWGMLRLDDVAYFAGGARNLRVWDFRNATGIASGETRDYNVQVTNNAEPLKVTLAWSDPPPASSSWAAPTVNDLDLTVIAPGGAITFLGNQFGAGNQSVTGGASDTINTVEQVLVNAPAVGMWTLRVSGTAVNVGNPFQGFALVATADTPDPAPPTGDQDTLVVRVRFPDPDLVDVDPPLPSIQNTMTDVVAYVTAASYGNATVVPEYHPTVINLDHPSDQYFPPLANPLIEMSEEVISKLLAADAAVLTGDPASATDDIDRIVLVTNDPDFNGDWATTGSWPFDVAGLGFPISVSIQSFENNTARFSHGLLHQLGLIDLYAHEGVVFAFAHANDWDNMAKPFEGQHSLLWNKQRPQWVGIGDPDVHWIPRPGAGGSYGGLNPIPISNQTDASGTRKGIMIGLTEAAATPSAETIFYYVEARTTADTYDVNVPESGVLIYYVNDNVAQGEGPVWLLDADPGTSTLGDAAFQIGESRSIPGTGITIDVLAGSGGADYNIQVAYAPPNTDNDVNIVMGDTIGGDFKSYMSPDIWVDNNRNGFDENGGGAPNPGNTDQPIEGEINRLYFRLHNPGPSDAYDVNVHVRMSEPYHTVSSEADFNRFVGQVHLATIAAGGTDPIRFVEWIPDSDGNPHSCAWVETLSVFNDVNTFNNAAQENLREVTSTTASPYTEVSYPVSFSNPYDSPHLFYFIASGIPDDWTRSLAPRKALLAPGERIEVLLTVKPPDNAPVCSNELIELSSWASRGDTLVQVGSGASQVGLRAATEITTEVEQRPCGRNPDKDQTSGAAGTLLIAASPNAALAAATHLNALPTALTPEQLRSCSYIVQKGCTEPPRPFEEVIIRYEDPSGNPVYHSVITDANGCFEDFYVAAEGGVWTATAEYPGSDCSGPDHTDPVRVDVQVASDGDQDNDGRPDKDEHPADADNDGLTGPMDTDSDNDGVDDADEPDGDFDGDGLINVIDPDSDGDGIVDGKDATPWGEGYRPPKDKCTALCAHDRRWLIVFGALLLLTLVAIWIALLRRSR